MSQLTGRKSPVHEIAAESADTFTVSSPELIRPSREAYRRLLLAKLILLALASILAANDLGPGDAIVIKGLE